MDDEKVIIKQHNHFSYVIEKSWAVIAVIVVFFLDNIEALLEFPKLLAQGELKDVLLTIGVILVLLIGLVVILWLRWRKTTITVKDGTVILERDTMNKVVHTIAVTNISNINLEQNLFEMLMDTYKLKLDTDTYSTADETDVEIVLKKDKAYAVKNLIMEMMQEAKGESSESLEADVENTTSDNAVEAFDIMENDSVANYDVAYTNKQVLKNTLLELTIFQLLLILGCLIAAVWYGIETSASGKSFSDTWETTAILVITAGSGIVAIIKKGMLNWNFRVKRSQDKIYVSSGLLKKKKFAVPVHRINAVVMQATVFSRIAHMYSVKVINVGGEDEDATGMPILLMGTETVLREQMAILLPEFEMPELSLLKKQPASVFGIDLAKSTIWIGIITWLVTYLIGVPEAVDATMFITIKTAIILFLLFFFYLQCYLDYKTDGILVRDTDVIICNGAFAKTVATIPLSKIQYIQFSQGPFEKMIGVQHGSVSILASIINSIHGFGSFHKEELEAFELAYRDNYGNKNKL